MSLVEIPTPAEDYMTRRQLKARERVQHLRREMAIKAAQRRRLLRRLQSVALATAGGSAAAALYVLAAGF